MRASSWPTTLPIMLASCSFAGGLLGNMDKDFGNSNTSDTITNRDAPHVVRVDVVVRTLVGISK